MLLCFWGLTCTPSFICPGNFSDPDYHGTISVFADSMQDVSGTDHQHLLQNQAGSENMFHVVRKGLIVQQQLTPCVTQYLTGVTVFQSAVNSMNGRLKLSF